MELVDELRIKNEELELENKILIEKVKENKLLKKRKQGNERTVGFNTIF